MFLVRITLVSAACAALLGVGCGASDGHKASAASPAATTAKAAVPPASAVSGDTALNHAADQARVEGSDSARLWMVEVSDFQCPFCREWHTESYAAIKKEYIDTGKIRFAYINFPLSIHRNAWPAAEAAMCAAAQNKFWQMHDALFASQDRWGELPNPEPVLDSLAASVGVSSAPYMQCIAQHEMRSLIQADIDRATESGVRSTPTFLIGGKMVEGAQPLPTFEAAIDEALKAQQ